MNPEMVIQELNSAIQKAEALLETMVAKSGGPALTAEKRELPEAKPLAAEMPHKPKGQGDSDEEVSDQAAVVVADKQGQKQDESDGHAKSDVGDLELTGQGKVVDGRVEAEGKAKIRLTDDLSLETLFKTDSKKSAFGGSVLFNAVRCEYRHQGDVRYQGRSFIGSRHETKRGRVRVGFGLGAVF